MQSIILCAGFATRLYPLTQWQPKHLLPLGKRSVLDFLTDRLAEVSLDQATLVCNHRFYSQFEQWAEQQMAPLKIELLDNGVDTPENRRGSIGDLNYALEHLDIRTDFMVIHGDNLFTFDLAPPLAFFRQRGNTLVTYDVGSRHRARRAGQATCNSQGVVTDFVEKPHVPRTTRVSIGIYLYKADVRHKIDQYLQLGLPADRSGDMIQWLHRQTPIHAFPISNQSGVWFDIGSLEDYLRAADLFG